MLVLIFEFEKRLLKAVSNFYSNFSINIKKNKSCCRKFLFLAGLSTNNALCAVGPQALAVDRPGCFMCCKIFNG